MLGSNVRGGDRRPVVAHYHAEGVNPPSADHATPVAQYAVTYALQHNIDISPGDVIEAMRSSDNLDHIKEYKNAAKSIIDQGKYHAYWASSTILKHAVSGFDVTAGFTDLPEKLEKKLEDEQFSLGPRSMEWRRPNNAVPILERSVSAVPCNLSSRAIKYATNSWGADKKAPIGRIRTVDTTYIPATRAQEREELLRSYEEAKNSIQRRVTGA